MSGLRVKAFFQKFFREPAGSIKNLFTVPSTLGERAVDDEA